MVEVRVGRSADVHFRDWKVVEVPVPFTRRVVAPWIDHHRHTLWRSDLKGRRAEVGDLHQTVLGGRRVLLQFDHPVVV